MGKLTQEAPASDGCPEEEGKKLSPRATGSKKVESETNKAQKLMTLFNTSMIQAQQVLGNIKQDPEWAQFKGPGEPISQTTGGAKH